MYMYIDVYMYMSLKHAQALYENALYILYEKRQCPDDNQCCLCNSRAKNLRDPGLEAPKSNQISYLKHRTSNHHLTL